MMTNTSLSLGAALLVLTGSVCAAQPLALTDGQMDQVSAGALVFLSAAAIGQAEAASGGNLFSVTHVHTHSDADPLGVLGAPSAWAKGQTEGVAASVYSPATATTAAVFAPAFAAGASSAGAQID